MKKEPHFIFDEEWDEQERELRQILHETRDPELHKNVFVLESIMRAAALGFVRKKTKENILLGKEIAKPKYYQKVLNIPSGVEVEPVPVPGSGKLQEVSEFKEVPKYRQKIVLEEEKEGIDFSETREGKRNLITDRITKRVLASVNIKDNRYHLDEPSLDALDLKVLDKIKKKRIKNMEKGWKLIQEYGKKYGIKVGHDTSIKYYIVNDVFGLGRIEPLFHDQEIENIKCEGAEKNLIIRCGDKELISDIKFNIGDLKSFNHGIASRMGKKINKKTPNVIGELRGFRFMLRMGDNLDEPSFDVKKI